MNYLKRYILHLLLLVFDIGVIFAFASGLVYLVENVGFRNVFLGGVVAWFVGVVLFTAHQMTMENGVEKKD